MPQIAYCDAGVALNEDYYLPSVESSESTVQKNSLYYSTKEYRIELKPIFSAFHWKNFAVTSLRSFLLFYLPLLEPHAKMEEDDDDFLQDTPEEQQVDLVVPFKKSVKQILREVSSLEFLNFHIKQVKVISTIELDYVVVLCFKKIGTKLLF